jgi:1,2-diacylglycerol 3-beta-glucosyltransferase
MATRLIAFAILVLAGLIAWLAVTSTLAARTLQAIIGISVVYVGYLAYRGLRVMRTAGERAGGATLADTDMPFVNIIIPARDEASVIGDLIEDLSRQSYAGRDGERRYDVLVVDDGSTDGTAQVASDAGGYASEAAWLRVAVRPLGSTPATKAAALAWGMGELRGDVIGALDADARVAPDFLVRVMRAWHEQPGAAAIQASRTPTNADAGWLQRAQAEEQLMDLASQCGRWATDGSAELRGNGMFVRRAALDAVGGWTRHAITEDLDLSTRLAAAGERIALAPEAQVGEEAVEHLADLWPQRLRWAEGSLRRLIEYGPRLLGARLSLKRKFDFLAFTGEFMIPPLFVAGVVTGLLSIPRPTPADWTVPVALAIGYGLGSFLLAMAGLAAHGRRGLALVGESTRGAIFLGHWLIVVPVALLLIVFGPPTVAFRKTPRVGHRTKSDR